MQAKFLIIGAGPTGLGAGLRLKELGENDFVIVEACDGPGGLARSFTDDQGFTWDIGGHIQFSHYQYYDEVMLRSLPPDGWLHHQRESWAWMKDRFVPYPVQNNIRYLPKESLWDCLEGLIEGYRKPGTTPQNFREWIVGTFGEGLAQHFLVPYNFKVWAHPTTEMSFQWIGERVAVTDLKRIVRNILFEKDDLSWGPNHTFKFPKQGGTGAIWSSVASELENKILFREKVTKVYPRDRVVELENGKTVGYRNLLSTMPLDLLCQKLPDSALKSIASGLKHSSSHIVGIGLKGQPPSALKTKCWMYFPENNCPFYRATVFSNYSPFNVPDAQTFWSLMTETSESTHKPVDREKLVDETITGLVNTKLIDPSSSVVSKWLYTAEYGYPVPTLERDRILATVLPELEKSSIYSRGRFGAWKYEVSNQDHCFMQGVEWVNRIILKVPELTYRFPNTANANWGNP